MEQPENWITPKRVQIRPTDSAIVAFPWQEDKKKQKTRLGDLIFKAPFNEEERIIFIAIEMLKVNLYCFLINQQL